MIGRTIGKYRIVDQLGSGGMGAVYRAVDETLDREVAVKVLHPGLQDGDVMKRFRIEAMTLAKLNHPEIATIFEIYRSEPDLLMVMELVRGETLDELSQRSGPLPPERAAYLVAQVLGALGHAHEAGIVHRDLKPANVMVAESGAIKIMDFGIARVVGAEHMTSDGLMMGTPAFMAPEQVMSKEVDGRADLYSCGVVFYKLLTAALPFTANTAIGMVQKQLSDEPTPVHAYRADLPSWCQTVLDRALAKQPDYRFQTAEEFRAALIAGIGTSGAERTSVYAAARLPDGTPLPAPIPVPAAIASAVPAAPKQIARPDNPTILLQRRHFAVAGALLGVVAIGVAVLAYVALRRGSSNAPAANAAVTGATVAVAAVTSPIPSAAAAQPIAAAPSPTARPIPTATPLPAVVTASVPKPSPAKPVVAAAKEPAAPFVFDAKAVVKDAGKNREHDATAQLGDGKVMVTDKNHSVIAVIPYGAIVGISHSNSKQPLWDSPSGPAEMMKVETGAFGFLKGGHNWVSLRTKDTSLVLRIDDDKVRRVIAALEERTRQKVVRVVDKS